MADTEGSVDHEIKYKFHFMKRGPEPKEFYDSLTSKMDGFIATIDLSEPEEKSINEVKKRAVDTVKKNVCIRQNISDPTKVDKRRFASKYYAKKGFLPNRYVSPQKAAKDSSGRQGEVKYTKKTHSDYKTKQDKLIARLKYFDNQIYDSNSSTEVYDSNSSTEEFCNYIDRYTLNIIKLLVKLKRLQLTTKLKILIINNISIMFDLCEHVVMGRIAVDWAQPNNLTTTSGWNNWRKHMCVLISFAAMLTTLFMVSSTLKKDLTVATYNSCIGIFRVLVVTDFIHRNCYTSCNTYNLNIFCILVNMYTFPDLDLFLYVMVIFRMSN